MHEPALLQKEAADDLKSVLDEYPFSGVLHALYVKALKNQGNYLYPKQLKRTAIAVPDRKVLHAWTEKPVVEKSLAEEKPALDFAARPKIVEKPKVAKPPQESPPEKTEQPSEAPPRVEVDEKVKLAESPAASTKPAAPKPEPTKPQEPKKPIVVAKPERTKETDLDLSNLPASVRETVLRARKLRQRYGQEEESKVPPGPIPPVVVNKPKPVEDDVTPDPVPEEKPKVPETTQEPEPVVEEAPQKESVVFEEPPVEKAKEEPDFELAADEPIEEERERPVESAPKERERHSFLDWLETPHEEEEEPVRTPPKEIEGETEALSDLTFEPDFGEDQKETEKAEKASTERMQELYASFMDKPKIDFRAPSKEPQITAASLGTSADSRITSQKHWHRFM